MIVGVLSTDEIKLFARAFAAMMPDTLIRIALRVIDALPDNTPKSNLDNARPERKLSKQSLLQYFSALATLLQKNEDGQASYFIIYAALNLINSLKLVKQVDQPML